MSATAHNLIGHRFGHVTVIERVPAPAHWERQVVCWRCRCDCGEERQTRAVDLSNGIVVCCVWCAFPVFKATDHASLPGEEWRDVGGSAGRYQVSNLGRFARRSVLAPEGRFLSAHRETPKGSIVKMVLEGKHTSRSLARLVALAFLGPPPNYNMVAVPRNAVKHDNRANNLMWARSRFAR